MTAVAPTAASDAPLTAQEVFDSIGPAYEDAFAGLPEQTQSVEWLLAQLKDAGAQSARFVDIGCGTGRPVCLSLANAGHDVLGIDVSAVMVAAARERVPNARFEQMDMCDFNPPQSSNDAASVYFSLIASVTQDDIRRCLAKIYRLLRPGGFFVFATVPEDAESMHIKWMGQSVTVSSQYLAYSRMRLCWQSRGLGLKSFITRSQSSPPREKRLVSVRNQRCGRSLICLCRYERKPPIS